MGRLPVLVSDAKELEGAVAVPPVVLTALWAVIIVVPPISICVTFKILVIFRLPVTLSRGVNLSSKVLEGHSQ